MTFTIGRREYDTYVLKFDGVPDSMVAGDVTPEALVTFEIECTEDLQGDLRRELTNPQGFWCEVIGREHSFTIRDARLITELPDIDYARRRVRFSFQVRREGIIRMTRPMGALPIDKYDLWQRQLHTIHQDHQFVRRRRIELDKAYADLDEHKAALAKFEDDVQGRKAALFDHGEREWVEAAVKRWV